MSRRSASFDQRSFFTALRDVVAAAPVVRGTFVDLPSVDAVFDGSISASRIRGPARAYRQVAARCMRLVGAAIILVRDDVKGSAQRIDFTGSGLKSRRFRVGLWSAVFAGSILPGRNGAEAGPTPRIPGDEFAKAMQACSVAKELMHAFDTTLSTSAVNDDESSETMTICDRRRNGHVQGGKQMVTCLSLCEYAQTHETDVCSPGHRVSLQTILGAEMLTLRTASRDSSLFSFDPPFADVTRNVTSDLIDMITNCRLVCSPRYFIRLILHLCELRSQALTSLEFNVRLHLPNAPSRSNDRCAATRLLVSIVHEGQCLVQVKSNLESFLAGGCVNELSSNISVPGRMSAYADFVRQRLGHAACVALRAGDRAFKWDALLPVLKRCHEVDDVRFVAEALCYMGFVVSTGKADHYRMTSDEEQRTIYDGRFQDIVRLEDLRCFVDWVPLLCPLTDAGRRAIDSNGGRASVNVSKLAGLLEQHVKIGDYRIGPHRYRNVFLADAAVEILMLNRVAKNPTHATAILTVMLNARAFVRVPRPAGDEISRFDSGRALYRLASHEYRGIITPAQFKQMIDLAFIAGNAENVTVRHPDENPAMAATCSVDFPAVLDLMYAHLNCCADQHALNDLVEFTGSAFASLMMTHVVCADVPCCEMLGDVLLGAGVIVDLNKIANDHPAFRAGANYTYGLKPRPMCEQTQKPATSEFVAQIQSLSSIESVGTLVRRMHDCVPMRHSGVFDRKEFFRAADAVEFFIKHNIASTDSEAVKIGQLLELTGAIEPLTPGKSFHGNTKFSFSGEFPQHCSDGG
ncbi:DEP domain-containing protein [Plasmodiophora brassicae]|uniref:DEP domain-containing protein n=1 Tax=Plasmodiophora brassicae TaxID=37360 RepID=A0A0G4ITG1_PLABS|nr:hypothetical protein PBRA_006510 [Plasmodiophora brassicae]